MEQDVPEGFWQRLQRIVLIIDTIVGLPAKIGIFATFFGGILVAATTLIGRVDILLIPVVGTFLTGIFTLFVFRKYNFKGGYDEGYMYLYREAVYKYLPNSNRRSILYAEKMILKTLKPSLTSYIGAYAWRTYGTVKMG